MRKSWRMRGILYLAAASSTMGVVVAQTGHSRSTNSTMATRAPAGGWRDEVSWTWVGFWAWAQAAARRISATGNLDMMVGRLSFAIVAPNLARAGFGNWRVGARCAGMASWQVGGDSSGHLRWG